ncbi:major facilitator superfamily MFS_1 [Reticulomyxa filosa]|uniref:Major facilitator superfamily MFS_1 n=1 Tax=Reticulomyxa filosa TaxID=46433 RepID=X6LYU7_RETFI|nr:major facilitator superfamily MFS_1 [Reticulomyxa filosa]|eukprot:ETO06799.1 major facilitator superfamily MFS_1 [Reticulomyxa filosa]
MFVLKTDQKQPKVILPSLTVEETLRTPHFWLMWVAFFSGSTAGMGVISTAKTMMSQSFGPLLPNVVTAGFAMTYVMAISAANLTGRFGWGAISDKIGQFATFTIFGSMGCALYISLPYCVEWMAANPSVLPLAMFYGSSLLLISFFGGNFSAMPAYESNLFGRQNVGAIHGRMMTACALSGLAGPRIVTYFNQRKEQQSIRELAQTIDSNTFVEHFGSPIQDIDKLIQTKTVTINKLLNIIPPDAHAIDPTPFLYNDTLYVMSIMMASCAAANFGVRFLGMPKKRLQKPIV